MVSGRDALEVGAGVALGYGVARVVDHVKAKQERRGGPTLEEMILFPDNYNGRPVGVLEGQVLREMEEERRRKNAPPPKKTYTAEDVKRVFDPPATAYPGALGTLSPALKSALAAIGAAPSLDEALERARQIPELFQVADQRSATVFELRLDRADPDSIPNFWHKTYATRLRLVAQRGFTRNHFRLQAVQQDAIRENNVLQRLPDLLAFDRVVRTDFLTGAIASKPVSPATLQSELRGELTPPVLAAALTQLLETGLPLRVDRPY